MGNGWCLGNSEEVSGAESREAIGADNSTAEVKIVLLGF